MPAKAGIQQSQDPLGTSVPCSHSSDYWIIRLRDDDSAKTGGKREPAATPQGPLQARLISA
jgi:hypothetical protein